MQEYRIKRMNLDDLVFTGVMLASVDDENRTVNSSTRLQLALYHTVAGAYILGIILSHNGISEEKVFNGAITFASLEDIHLFLLSEEGRSIADLVYLLLAQLIEPEEEVAEARKVKHHIPFRERETVSAKM
ncbi:hypothetical protein SAMN05660653_02587 [Desulfonatronum thiosulfatophilum]|uniref:Uncharacterized protein n=1 Tax=Desulfonatronum thiosulfatophilum TaxID=617002 RepID=A0A1G6E3L8_9BACT|nr:hypothetical protein [Desulfonatronum thiosulfatophilum]SDB52006.1 hypothetical protein SAMN05660653_02587 [Desulfonatronum thiosulfatophilum]